MSDNQPNPSGVKGASVQPGNFRVIDGPPIDIRHIELTAPIDAAVRANPHPSSLRGAEPLALRPTDFTTEADMMPRVSHAIGLHDGQTTNQVMGVYG